MEAPQRISFDVRTPLVRAPELGHNRWHPDIPPIARVAPGETIVLDVRDGMDGQVTADTRPEDILAIDGKRGIPLTGPLFVEGAEPGDFLEVETLHIEPDRFAWSAMLPTFTFLGERFAEPYVVKWSIDDMVARSDDLPGVAIRGAPFMGAMGVTPSHERLRQFAQREAELAARGGFVLPPDPTSAVPAAGPAATEGIRIVPPRENGGNMDLKQLTVGSRLLLEVEVPGGLFSVGDPHFAQGDGETGGSAIEMHATVHLRFGLRKASEVRWRPRCPAVEFVEPPSPAGRRYLVTTGIPVDPEGRNHSLDVTLAAKMALNEMIEYLVQARGYTPEQACIIAGVAADIRCASLMNVPNVLVSAVLPLDIFEDKLEQA